MTGISGRNGFVRYVKETGRFLALSWCRNVLLFPEAARIIGKKNERRDGHDLQTHDEKADGRSYCFHF